MTEWTINTNYQHFTVQTIEQQQSQQVVVLTKESILLLDILTGKVITHNHVTNNTPSSFSWSSCHPNHLLLGAKNKLYMKSIATWKTEFEAKCDIEDAG